MSEEQFELIRQQSEEYVEYIEGILYKFSSPSYDQQQVSLYLSTQLFAHFRKSECGVAAAPFDVVLSAEGMDNQRVIPDLTVFCNKNGLGEGRKRFTGIPDFIVEILSPSNQQHDLVTKMNLYAKYDIPEYWIINPLTHSLSIYTLEENGYYVQSIVEKHGTVQSFEFPDLVVDLDDMFDY